MEESFGIALAQAIKSAGFTQLSFAKSVGVNQGQLSRVLRSQRRPPMDALPRWFDLLAVTGAERERLLLLANLAHCPPWMYGFIDRLLHHLADAHAVQAPALFKRLAETTTTRHDEDPPPAKRRTRRS